MMIRFLTDERPTHRRCLLAELLLELPPGLRGSRLHSAVSFRPDASLDGSFAVGPLRAAFAELWESRFGEAVPANALRQALEPPVPIGTVLHFNKLVLAQNFDELERLVAELLDMLRKRAEWVGASTQRTLFVACELPKIPPVKKFIPAETVSALSELVEKGRKFPTIYADPPWPYENEASRGAAVNHYPTLSLSDIEAEPVRELAAEDAHLHLWTTNGFLREALRLVDVWGFEFKSCLVWVKDDLGMGNYWRVSHEFLLLGVRGSLTFRDRTRASWIQAGRTIHSRKPAIVRTLIERVSPGPYLELYGREELPDSDWTVYGNQVERRML